MSKTSRGIWTEIGILVLGSAVYAAAFCMFIAPQGLLLGGATGLATFLYGLCGLPVGVGVLLCNLPLLIWGTIEKGWRLLARTGVGVVLSSLFLELGRWLPPLSLPTGEAAVFGGALAGVGLGLLYLRGYTTGGSDLAGVLLHHHIRKISVGRWILILDTAVVLLSLLGESGGGRLLYSVILNFALSIAFDAVVRERRGGSLALIITRRQGALERAIRGELRRGVTECVGIGAYERTERRVLLCAVERGERARLRALVQREDPACFMVLTDVGEVVGNGFSAEDG